MATDFLGNKLEVGCNVVFMRLGNRALRRGRVIKITDCKVRIKPDTGSHREVLQFHEQVIVVDKLVQNSDDAEGGRI